MTPAFQTLPADKYYPGMTRYTTPDGRTFACMGVGHAVEQALLKRAETGKPSPCQ